MTSKHGTKSENKLYETDEKLIKEAMKEKIKVRRTGLKNLKSLEEIKKNV